AERLAMVPVTQAPLQVNFVHADPLFTALGGAWLPSMSALPPSFMLADHLDRLLCCGYAPRNLKIDRLRKVHFVFEHVMMSPLHQVGPHIANQDERSIVKLANLQKLPHHGQLEQRAHASRHDNERVRGDDEVMKPGEEGLMLKSTPDKRVGFVLERQIDADANRALCHAASPRCSFVSCLHEPGSAACYDSAAKRAKSKSQLFDQLIALS